MAIISYYQIQLDLSSLLLAGPSAGYTTDPKHVFIEAMEREVLFDNMPLINVRLPEGEIEVRSLPNGYYAFLTFEIDVICFSLTHFSEAAKLRDIMMGEAQLAIQQNSRFSGDIATSTVAGPLRFGAGTPEGAGGHIAVGTFTANVELEIEAT